MGFPGDTPEEKMKDCIFTLEEELMAEENSNEKFPQVVAESFQVMECTWMRELDNAQDDAADRIDDEISFTDEACAKLVKVPRIFLNTALKGCVKWAKENNADVIDAEHMDIINDKRAKEKE